MRLLQTAVWSLRGDVSPHLLCHTPQHQDTLRSSKPCLGTGHWCRGLVLSANIASEQKKRLFKVASRNSCISALPKLWSPIWKMCCGEAHQPADPDVQWPGCCRARSVTGKGCYAASVTESWKHCLFISYFCLVTQSTFSIRPVSEA